VDHGQRRDHQGEGSKQDQPPEGQTPSSVSGYLGHRHPRLDEQEPGQCHTSPVALARRFAPPGTRPFDVVAMGEASLDLVAMVDWPIDLDEKREIEIFERLPGGQAATVAATCARQGFRVRYVGCLGSDDSSRDVRAALEAHGIDVVAAGPAGVRGRIAVILVDRASGRRTIFEHRDRRLRLDAASIDRSIVTSGRVLMVDATNIEAAATAAKMAKAEGIPTVVDIEKSAPGLDALLQEIDFLIVAGSFPAAYTGAATTAAGLKELAARFRPAIAVATLGAEGSLAICDGQEIRTPAPDVKVVDTTGAGDVFRGGLIAGWLRFGPAAGVHTILEYANACAAFSCQGLGAQGSLPNRADADAFVTGTARVQSK
jgi:sulfofructose kinase